MSSIPPPSSPNDIITCLSLALSPSPQTRSTSLASLQAWSTLPGYYSLLTRIFTEKSGAVQDQVRLQALLQFKNGVDKYWRRHSINAISAEEKSTIRPLLLTMIDEPNRILAKNLAVTIGKLARLDYGTDWNELPPFLLHSLHTSQSLLTLHRSLLYLHSTLKSLSSNRTPKGRLYLKQMFELLFDQLVGLHKSLLERTVERLGKEGFGEGGRGGEGGNDEVECALLSGKCLRLLTIYGHVDPAENSLIKDYFASTLPTFLSLLQLRLQLLSNPSSSSAVTSDSPRLQHLTKLVIGQIKLWRLLIDHKNVEYFDRMGITRGVLEAAWGVVREATTTTSTTNELGGGAGGVRERVSDSSTALYPTRLLIPSLLLLKSTLSSWDGHSPLEIPLAFIHSLTRCLVESCLVLKVEELEQWDLDAEEFVNEEEENEGKWEFELRPASEVVLKSLVGGYKEDVGGIMKSYLQEDRIRNPKNMEDLLLKESVYNGIGKSLGDLGDSINFDEWLKNSLLPEALSTDTNYRLIRRRISSLLGSLLASDPSPTSLPLIYELLTHLLSRNSSTDPAIRLTSVKSLQKSDTWDFNLQAFLPFLSRVVEDLVDLLESVELGETRMRVMSALGVVVARVEGNIEPYANQLVEVMSRLWILSNSNQQSHFQTSILVTLTRLSEALGEKSQSLHSPSRTIIQFSVDSTLPSHIYLQEDALELWSVLLKRSSTLTNDLLELVPKVLMGLIGDATDLLPKLLNIFESYLLLDSQRVLELCAFEFFKAVSGLMEGLSLEAVKVVLHSINMVFKCASGGGGGGEVWAGAVDTSEVFVRLLEGIGKPDTPALVVTKYLCSIARIILASPNVFHSLVSSTSIRTQTSSNTILSLILNQFIERLDNMSQGGQRKIVALALAELVVSNNPVVLSRLPDLVALWSGVLAQTEETQEGDAELYHVTDDYTSEVEYDYTETLETLRKSALTARDPMITSKLSSFIGERLTRAQEVNGGQEEFARLWLSQVDPIVVEELVKRLEGKLKG